MPENTWSGLSITSQYSALVSSRSRFTIWTVLVSSLKCNWIRSWSSLADRIGVPADWLLGVDCTRPSVAVHIVVSSADHIELPTDRLLGVDCTWPSATVRIRVLADRLRGVGCHLDSQVTLRRSHQRNPYTRCANQASTSSSESYGESCIVTSVGGSLRSQCSCSRHALRSW